jgi:MFS family permease
MTPAVPLSNAAATKLLLGFASVVFLGYLAVGVPFGVLPGFVHATLGFGPFVVGLTIGLQSLSTLSIRGLAGHTADHRGGRFATLIGALGCAGSALAYLAASRCIGAPGLALACVLAGRIASGIGEGFLITGALGWCLARVGPSHAGRAMVWVGIAMFGAVGIGAPIGTWLSGQGGLSAVSVLLFAAPLLGAVLAAMLPGVPVAGGTRLSFFRVVGLVWRLGGSLSLCTMGFGTLSAFVGLYFAQGHWHGASFALSVFAVGFVLSRLFFGHLPDRIGGRRVALVTIPTQALGTLLLGLAPGPLVAFAGAALVGFGYSMTFPALGVEVVRRVPPQNRGAAMGAYVAFVDIGLGLTGPVQGVVAGLFGYAAPFLVATLGAGVAWLSVRAMARNLASASDL